MSLLSGAGLPVGFLISCLFFTVPVLLSGTGLSVRFLIYGLGLGLPVGGQFS